MHPRAWWSTPTFNAFPNASGLDQADTPEKIEQDLMKVFPQKDGIS